MAEITLPNGFTARPYQLKAMGYYDNGGKRGVWVWPRRAGKDLTFIHQSMKEAHARPGTYYHLLPNHTQARKVVWDGISNDGKRVLDVAIPAVLRSGENATEMKITLKCGSIWQLVGADYFDTIMGTNPFGLVFSEAALTDPRAWSYFRPILANNGGWASFISTPRGYNWFYDLLELAKSNSSWGWSHLSTTDTKHIPADVLAQEKAEMPDELYRQEYLCFTPDAMVACADRSKPISTVVVGDIVVTHTGRMRRVDRTIQKNYVGDMVTIESFGSRPLVCTPEHPIYVCNPVKQTYAWCKAGDLKPKDWIVTPRLDTQQKPVISEHLARIIGWFVCEGCVAGNNLNFSIGAHEPEYVRELQEALTAEGYKSTVTRMNNAVTVSVNSAGLSDFLVSQCGSLSYHKRLPLGLLRGNERVVWDTLFKGDGCITVKPTSRYSYMTVSEGLAQQVQLIGAALGYRGSYSIRQPHSSVIRGRTIRGGVAYLVQMSSASRYASRFTDRTRSAKNGALGRVSSVTRDHYDGIVHNLQVAGDNSYTVNTRAVHNCDFSAANIGAILGRYMERAEIEGRITDDVCYLPEGDAIEISSDIGFRDTASWWFWQADATGFTLIDYDEDSGMDADDWIERLKKKRYHIGKIWLPHDSRVKTFQSKHSAMERFLRAFGQDRIGVVPSTKIPDRINAGRVVINKCRFARTACKVGLAGLRAWSFEYDEERKTFSATPRHDFASHPSDAYTYGCQIMRKRVSAEEKKIEIPRSAETMTLDDWWAVREEGISMERRI